MFVQPRVIQVDDISEPISTRKSEGYGDLRKARCSDGTQCCGLVHVDKDGGENRQATRCCQSPSSSRLISAICPVAPLFRIRVFPHTSCQHQLSSLTVIHTKKGFLLRSLVHSLVEVLLVFMTFEEGVYPYGLTHI